MCNCDRLEKDLNEVRIEIRDMEDYIYRGYMAQMWGRKLGRWDFLKAFITGKLYA